MDKLIPAFQVIQNNETGEIEVNYSISAHREKLDELQINQKQITNLTLDNLPGIRIDFDLTPSATGNPNGITGSFKLDPELKFDPENPYLDIGLYVVNSGDRKRRGGGIVRHEDIDFD